MMELRSKALANRIVITSIILVGLGLVGPGAVWGEQAVKVHKDMVKVYPPDEQGKVVVVGGAGAITSNNPVKVDLIHLGRNEKVPMEINTNGSFRAEIAAVSGEKIRVLARNKEGRSYGTFTVPPKLKSAAGEPKQLQPLIEKIEAVSEVKISPVWRPAGTADKLKNDEMELAVIITVVDTKTGEIAAVRRIAGVSKAKQDQKEAWGKVVDNIMEKCARVVEAELQRQEAGDKEVKR